MNNKPTYIMLSIGLLMQITIFLITKDAWLSFISGIAGVFSVVFCSERRMSYYIWSFIQIITFSIICIQENLYGKLFENIFYAITLFVGIWVWLKNKDNDNKVRTRSLSAVNMWLCIIFCGLLACLLYVILSIANDAAPILDAVSTSLAILAQILMILRYKENWNIWMIVNALCIFLFIKTENWCMVAQYLFWLINTIYGYEIWSRYEEKS